MRILHTADWHVGKKLGRIDRTDETERVLNELVEVARAEEVDCVIVAGDLFDRALTAYANLGLVLETLVRLADAGGHVVAVPGNHDSPDLFEVLGPYLEEHGVTLVHKPLRPDAGGVVEVKSRDGSERAQIACLPFLHEAQVVDFMERTEEWHKSYADRIRKLCDHYARYMRDHDDAHTVDVLVGHFMVHGAVPSGSERQLHIGEAYMAREDSIPNVHYAALGHIHLTQHAPGTSVPAWYAGSLMQLDFGEIDQDKFALVVDVKPGGTADPRPVPITGGRRLMRVTDSLEKLRRRAGEFGDAILDVGVTTDGPHPGLAEIVRDFLPHALHVRAEYEREAYQPATRQGMALDDLYAEYFKKTHETDPDPELVGAFRELCDEVGVNL